MKKVLLIWVIGISVLTNVISAETNAPPLANKTALSERVCGKRIKDPYRWMENKDDASLYQWLNEQENYTDAQTSGALRNQLSEEFSKIYKNRTRTDAISDDLLNMRFLEERGFQRHRFQIKQNKNTDGGRIYKMSPSNRYEITLSPANTDIKTVQIYDSVIDGYLNDTFQVKFSSFAWDTDEKSFIYCTDRDGRLNGATFVIRRHYLGSDPRLDVVLFESTDNTDYWNLDTYDDGSTWLSRNDEKEQVYTLSRLNLEEGTEEIFFHKKAILSLLDYADNKFWFTNFSDQDMGEIITFDISSRTFSQVVSARDVPIDKALIYGDDIYITYVRNAANELVRYNVPSKTFNVIDIPEQGSVDLDSPSQDGIVFYVYTCVASYSTYSYQKSTGEVTLVSAGSNPDVELDASLVEYEAHKGWTARMWVVKRKDISFTTDTPVCMYGYGGFRVNVLPFYSQFHLPWLKHGGALAIVELPGGLEYGEAWHRLGALHNKRNVFDAFANAAKALIAKGWTSQERLTMMGASNGGLLVAATARLYPKLYKVAVPEVGVHDMIRFPLFTGGVFWVYEYGNPSDPDDLKNLLSYSPYHNIRKGMKYPSTLVVTADLDDRVFSAHSYKLAAALQEALSPKKSILLLVSHGAGHSFTNTPSVDERIRVCSTLWAFVMQELGME